MPSRVLVVDDDPFLRRILSFLLAGAGHEVECVEDGEQAWDRLCRAAGDPPDLVISDLMMPGMSGLDLVRRMRARPEFGIPVLI
ncbi:MAG: response regulator, partial [Candidatus Eisenbacteria bacterium]|nr:response regulator [Candidatus Eisenbacteria bacterium]